MGQIHPAAVQIIRTPLLDARQIHQFDLSKSGVVHFGHHRQAATARGGARWRAEQILDVGFDIVFDNTITITAAFHLRKVYAQFPGESPYRRSGIYPRRTGERILLSHGCAGDLRFRWPSGGRW